MSVSLLQTWGMFLWVIGILLIAWGLIPYKYLKNVSEKPNAIYLDDEEIFHYISRGKTRLSLKLSSIEKVLYVDDPKKYGISMKVRDRDYFFPYFTENSFHKLECYIA